MTTIQYVNLSLQICGCVMSFVVMICLLLGKHLHRTGDDLYFRMLLLNTGVMLFDAIALLCRGKENAVCLILIRAGNFLAYTCNYLLLAAFLHYLINYLKEKDEVSSYPLKATRLISAIFIVLLIVNLFHPIFYVIDEQNFYHRASLFWLSQIPGILGMFLGGTMIFRHRLKLEAQEQVALWSYICMPLFALCFQIFIYGVAALNLASTVALVIVFLFIQSEKYFICKANCWFAR